MQKALFMEAPLTPSERLAFSDLIVELFKRRADKTGATIRPGVRVRLCTLLNNPSPENLIRFRSAIPMSVRFDPEIEKLLHVVSLYEPTWTNYEKWEKRLISF